MRPFVTPIFADDNDVGDFATCYLGFCYMLVNAAGGLVQNFTSKLAQIKRI